NKITFWDKSNGFFYRFNTDYQLSSHMNPLDLLVGIIQVEKELKKRNIENTVIDRIISTYLIGIGIMEMSLCNQDNVNKSFYEKSANYLRGKSATLKSETYEMYRKKWISLSYESKWFDKIGNYEIQLRDNRDELLKQVKSLDKPIVVWGMGKRGRAFIKFAFENEIDICAICDKENSECGSYDEYNNAIISTSEVLDMKDVVIVATTNQIFSDLKSVAKVTVIPLQIYCEL
ncbi:MAG: hypothetical protein IKW81_09800, partial [Pseudobutyrivibrio sp.]|nr:hypothetical protein [Pseudobutyrivibrio sp.]